MAAQDDHRGCVLDRHRPPQCRFERVGVVGDLADAIDVPSIGLESLAGIVAVAELGRAVDGDVVVVVDVDESPELQMACERAGFVADALFETAVAGDDERVVVACIGTEPAAQVALGDAHADPVAEALAEGPRAPPDGRACGCPTGGTT